MTTKSAPKLFGGASSQAGSGGTVVWATVTQGLQSNDIRAAASLTGVGSISQWLRVVTLAEKIPLDAQVLGLEVTIERQAQSGQIADHTLYLVKGLTPQGNNHARTAELWPVATDAIATYGGPDDLWGVPLDAADINGSGFGFALSAQKLDAGAGQARVDAIGVTIYYQVRGGRRQTAMIKFRENAPPYGAVCAVFPSALRYGFKLRREQIASFSVPRSDPNLPDIWRLLQLSSVDRPPMVTVERPDQAFPFVGFVQRVEMPADDPAITFTLADHAWRLRRSATLRRGRERKAAGQLIRDVIGEIGERAAPPLGLRVDLVEDGPPADYTFQVDEGLKFLEGMSKQAGGWEWGFSHSITDQGVSSYLLFTDSLGADRTADTWREGRHLVAPSMSFDFDEAIDSAVVVGGRGAIADRQAAEVNRTGKSAGGFVVGRRVSARQPGLGGTRIEFAPETSDPLALQRIADSIHDSPFNVSEAISLGVLETEIDPLDLAVGDRRRIMLTSANLGVPTERLIRILGIDIVGGSNVIGLEVTGLR